MRRSAVPSEADLAAAIETAARKAIRSLFNSHPGHFYYCSLITDGLANSPVLSAWSTEALERAALDRDDPEEARSELKWSSADSPYFAYGDEYFGEVRALISRRSDMQPGMSDREWDEEYETRLRAMETAMKRLASQGLFGEGEARLGIVINAEVMPPDRTNAARAIRLNPKEALVDWLDEAAEED